MTTHKSAPGDQATVSVFVAVEQEAAFEVFTKEVDLWWRRGPKYRVAGRRPGTLCFEPGAGGRLFESFETSSGIHVYEAGQVIAWEPPARLAFKWRGVNFSPDESTEVEVLFVPSGRGTLVTVHHRGWAALRPDHPARHGLEGQAFSRMMGLWWGEQMTALREHVDAREIG
jgi:hypothetical protein